MQVLLVYKRQVKEKKKSWYTECPTSLVHFYITSILKNQQDFWVIRYDTNNAVMG